MPDNKPSSPSTGTVPRRWRRVAVTVSLIAHAVLLALLAIWYVNRPRSGESNTSASTSPTASSAAADATSPPPPGPSPQVSSEQVTNTLERVEAKYEQHSAEEQLSALDEKAAELEALATEQSVEEIADKFREWTGIAPRAGAPADAPPEGEFQFETAQLHDVRKTVGEDDSVRYKSVLVDAAGRTLEVEMDAQEGERAYRTLQTLKEYPLADKVYRQIAMPLIDKAIAQREAAAASGEAIAAEPPDGEDDRDPFDGQLDKPAAPAKRPPPAAETAAP